MDEKDGVSSALTTRSIARHGGQIVMWGQCCLSRHDRKLWARTYHSISKCGRRTALVQNRR